MELKIPSGMLAIARFVSLHPHQLAQKAEIIVEQFRTHTAHKIGGRAKAMVVTSSRLHAVRYKQSIDAYIRTKGYTDIAALVAFSGKVIADDGEFTEPGSSAQRKAPCGEYAGWRLPVRVGFVPFASRSATAVPRAFTTDSSCGSSTHWPFPVFSL